MAKPSPTIKANLHPRNKHKSGYHFDLLVKAYAALAKHLKKNAHSGKATINFSDEEAVNALNTALLKAHYQLDYWQIPKENLCPAIPGRVDYIHYLADLLKSTSSELISNKQPTRVLDIGTGAGCIYPILGFKEYGWHFTGTDIDKNSITSAKKIISKNAELANAINCRLQKNRKNIFCGIIQPDDFYHLTMCNPPFHKSLADAQKGSQQKWQNLNQKTAAKQGKLNFSGQKAELWCEGGEVAFIRTMIKESKQYQKQVLWFTSLVSKKDSLSPIKLSLKKANVSQFKVVKMAQGQKISRFIAWSFQPELSH